MIPVLLTCACVPDRGRTVAGRTALPAVHVGVTATCAVASDGTAFCWGRIDGGPEGEVKQVVLPGGGSAPLASFEMGVWGGCGASLDGTVVCNHGGPATPAPDPLPDTTPRCASYACVDRLAASTLRDVVQVAVGSSHACALTAVGRAFCWGSNRMGQLGLGRLAAADRDSSGEPVRVPSPVVGSIRFTALSAGDDHTCGLGAGGEVYCWGYGQSGQVGDSAIMAPCSGRVPYTTGPCSTGAPHRVRTDVRFRQISAGIRMSCGVSTKGQVYCWGSNYRCELGRCGAPYSPVPVHIALPSRARSVDAGYWYACAVTEDGRGYCWGHNTSGQLGSLAEDPGCFQGGRCSPTPTEVTGGHRWLTISAGELHACGITVEGSVLCWGSPKHGRLGSGGNSAVCTNASEAWPDEPCNVLPRPVPGLPLLTLRKRESPPILSRAPTALRVPPWPIHNQGSSAQVWYSALMALARVQRRNEEES